MYILDQETTQGDLALHRLAIELYSWFEHNGDACKTCIELFRAEATPACCWIDDIDLPGRPAFNNYEVIELPVNDRREPYKAKVIARQGYSPYAHAIATGSFNDAER